MKRFLGAALVAAVSLVGAATSASANTYTLNSGANTASGFPLPAPLGTAVVGAPFTDIYTFSPPGIPLVHDVSLSLFFSGDAPATVTVAGGAPLVPVINVPGFETFALLNDLILGSFSVVISSAFFGPNSFYFGQINVAPLVDVSPTPLPGSMMLFLGGLGLMGALYMVRRRKADGLFSGAAAA